MFRFNLYVIASFLLIAFGSCEKESLTDTAPIAPTGALRVDPASCTAFRYADTIFYLRDQRENYIVEPVKGLSGTYGASPAGLAINASTGAINVTKSETGLRYRVHYVRAGTKDTCSRFITISGIDYLNSIHVLAKNDTLLEPLYNAKSIASMPCANGNANSKGNSLTVDGCEFDDDDDDDDKNGYDNEPMGGQQLRLQGVAVSKLNGVINLKQTVKNGTFGANPVSGVSRIFRLFYRIDDRSKKALNHIDVKLVYYNKVSDVPASLMSYIKTQNARIAAKPGTGTALSMNFERDTPSRPPVIIICGP